MTDDITLFDSCLSWENINEIRALTQLKIEAYYILIPNGNVSEQRVVKSEIILSFSMHL